MTCSLFLSLSQIKIKWRSDLRCLLLYRFAASPSYFLRFLLEPAWAAADALGVAASGDAVPLPLGPEGADDADVLASSCVPRWSEMSREVSLHMDTARS